MADLKDLRTSVMVKELAEPAAITADGYTDYIDTQGYNGVMFIVMSHDTGTDAAASPEASLQPVLYGYTGAAPGTASGYTLCASTEMNGSFTKIDTANEQAVDWVGLKQHLYRYYHIKWEVTGSPTGVTCGAAVVLSGRHQPADDDSPTTGAVS